ncbi:hydrogenase small subunit [Effusibacillus lacus]|uniref:hydrogenase small subunit n=1 Tax=Effusibacillus lacus TaxID=1348429 RepID=UPI000BB6FB77|nr:hydrogenase small subunit [Effusibacillus lacus]TCS72277.1 NiFe hydrogenase small subunit HydA [Effusibacillus lacus]
MKPTFEAYALDRSGHELELNIEAWSRLYGFDKERLREAVKKKRTPVIWINALDCTGCSESFLKSTRPSAADILMDWISLEYSEFLSASSGGQLEHAKELAIEKYKREYVLVVEGAIPLRDECLTVAGRSVREDIMEVAKGAKAVFAYGSCSAWGGIPVANPNPTGAVSLPELIPDAPVVLVPGCPPSRKSWWEPCCICSYTMPCLSLTRRAGPRCSMNAQSISCVSENLSLIRNYLWNRMMMRRRKRGTVS